MRRKLCAMSCRLFDVYVENSQAKGSVTPIPCCSFDPIRQIKIRAPVGPPSAITKMVHFNTSPKWYHNK